MLKGINHLTGYTFGAVVVSGVTLGICGLLFGLTMIAQGLAALLQPFFG